MSSYNIRDLKKPRYSDHALGFYHAIQDKADEYDCLILTAEHEYTLAAVYHNSGPSGSLDCIFGLDVITTHFVDKPLLCNKEDIFRTT
jgi:hypothetical protein